MNCWAPDQIQTFVSRNSTRNNQKNALVFQYHEQLPARLSGETYSAMAKMESRVLRNKIDAVPVLEIGWRYGKRQKEFS
jgi:hypothetical protein